jgi:hypothetical protein
MEKTHFSPNQNGFNCTGLGMDLGEAKLMHKKWRIQ